VQKVIHNKSLAQALVVCCGLLASADGGAVDLSIGPVDANGTLGYFYRSFVEENGPEDTSNQLSGTVNASTYFGEPWLATTNLSLSFTEDSSETREAGSKTTSDAQLLTGDVNLNVLPQSRTPFSLHLQATDSQVDMAGTGLIPITFVGDDYSTLYLGLRQSYLTDYGGRYMVNYDYHNWDSNRNGKYDENSLGFEADLQQPQQHFIGRGSYTINKHDLAERKNKNLLVDLSHFYYPVRYFRLDSKVSYYNYKRSFLDPSALDTRLAKVDITQLSTNAFWRPEDYPLSVTAGVRVLAMDGSENDVSGNTVDNLVFNVGMFYQLNNNLRLDATATSLFGKVDGTTENVHQQHAGFLYQTDLAEVWAFMYQAYLEGDVGHRIDKDDDVYDLAATAGHGFSKTWWLGERTSLTALRMHLSQSLGLHESSGDVVTSGARLDHSLTLAFNQQVWGGNTLAQITLSDSRDYASSKVNGQTTDTDTDQQLVNLQLSRDQDLGRRSSITGDITVQYVRVNGGVNLPAGVISVYDSETTTTTGRLMFEHFQMLGIPRLQFTSDYMVSRISTEGAIDRNDWDNRLSYMIGKLETSLSYRLTETDSRNYDLLYFRVMRRF
jgi:hypothetical protein